MVCLNLLALEELIERKTYNITYTPPQSETMVYKLSLNPSELREVLFFAEVLKIPSTSESEKLEKKEYAQRFIRIEDDLGNEIYYSEIRPGIALENKLKFLQSAQEERAEQKECKFFFS